MDNNTMNTLRNIFTSGADRPSGGYSMDTRVPPLSELDPYIQKVRQEIRPDGNPYLMFNRFRVPVSDPFLSNIAYIFFTRPDLNITDNLSSSNLLTTLNSTDFGQSILSSLSCTGYTPNLLEGPFIKILSNCVTNFETKDNSLSTENIHENFLGYKLSMPSTFIDSITADTITLNFMEYEDLRVTNLIKVWIEYIQAIKRGAYTPKEDYINQKILDYCSSIYYFLCAPDGHSIRFFTKLTGVFPTNIPYSSFSWEMGSAPDDKKLSVTFQYQIKEDMDIEILNDFNNLTDLYAVDGSPLGDKYAESWANTAKIIDGTIQFV